MVGDWLPLGHLGRAQVEAHPIVVARDGFDEEIGEPVDFQLEGHGWFQVAVDGVLFKLQGKGAGGRGRDGGKKERRGR